MKLWKRLGTRFVKDPIKDLYWKSGDVRFAAATGEGFYIPMVLLYSRPAGAGPDGDELHEIGSVFTGEFDAKSTDIILVTTLLDHVPADGETIGRWESWRSDVERMKADRRAYRYLLDNGLDGTVRSESDVAIWVQGDDGGLTKLTVPMDDPDGPYDWLDAPEAIYSGNELPIESADSLGTLAASHIEEGARAVIAMGKEDSTDRVLVEASRAVAVPCGTGSSGEPAFRVVPRTHYIDITNASEPHVVSRHSFRHWFEDVRDLNPSECAAVSAALKEGPGKGTT